MAARPGLVEEKYLCKLMMKTGKLLEGLHRHRAVAGCGGSTADRAVHKVVVLGSLQGIRTQSPTALNP